MEKDGYRQGSGGKSFLVYDPSVTRERSPGSIP